MLVLTDMPKGIIMSFTTMATPFGFGRSVQREELHVHCCVHRHCHNVSQSRKTEYQHSYMSKGANSQAVIWFYDG